MSLLEQLTNDMKESMKAKDKVTLGVVRMVKSSVSNEQIKLGHDLTADEELAVLSREMKQRVEELESYKDADREDLAEEIQGQIDVLKRYMPEQMSEEEVVAVVKETIAEVGASSKADLGKVMGALMPKVKGKADGKLVNQTVQSLLG
ncbi:GatB/YqeY domain-containing protein [Weissella confusa]|uniref:GatB/YqeY domain-containing protein n=1 Tax=Weissella confusa TaxID=1583 RepID=UPI0018F1BD75|nr:GatB/YqeY domain-containing protein [Weissella confusa]MBJ7618071.1 GatB/YqeY domain-containing protein [Weissella confusa]MBJ7624511.1 GatB/YqeY domain-containing protein [Weissella confusa]MBJ7649277.1 GatB/YqeY domain-containing protein [Weissella confusa]MBJ7650751.1 GatB/YqeY domain-containing protein [Weissella confusa]MBJ7657234.1 GatB/YqeY domain-containing protein [Weissella confusa]